jgi:hypothetical protein
MSHLSKTAIALLLSPVLGLWGGGAVGYGQARAPRGVSVVHLPATDARPSEAGVRRYVLRPQYRSSPYYVFAADTTAIPLLEGPTYGLYYAGKSRTDHSPSQYQVVYWFDHDLFWVGKRNDLAAQRKVLKGWLNAVGLRQDDPVRQRIQAKVEGLVKENQKRVASDVF